MSINVQDISAMLEEISSHGSDAVLSSNICTYKLLLVLSPHKEIVFDMRNQMEISMHMILFIFRMCLYGEAGVRRQRQ